MQKTVYSCDQCKKTLGDEPHFSFHFDRHSGVAVPPSNPLALVDPREARWHIEESLEGEFVHFCGIDCIVGFFRALLKRATTKKADK